MIFEDVVVRKQGLVYEGMVIGYRYKFEMYGKIIPREYWFDLDNRDCLSDLADSAASFIGRLVYKENDIIQLIENGGNLISEGELSLGFVKRVMTVYHLKDCFNDVCAFMAKYTVESTIFKSECKMRLYNCLHRNEIPYTVCGANDGLSFTFSVLSTEISDKAVFNTIQKYYADLLPKFVKVNASVGTKHRFTVVISVKEDYNYV